MFNKSFLLSSLAVLTLATVAKPTLAQELDNSVQQQIVLFKVHDVVPVKNADNQTTACDYHVTFYNRSSKNVNAASLLLTWTDTTIQNIINDENKSLNNSNKSASNYSNKSTTLSSATAKTTTPTVSSQVDISQLASQKQVSLRSRIQTDRCFLLTEPVDVKVKSCTLGSDATPADNKKRSSSRNSDKDCEGMFIFVSPENPEYYREFKPISYDEERSQLESKKAQDRNEINTQYDNVVNEITKVSTILAGIKADVPVDNVNQNPQSDSENVNVSPQQNLEDKMNQIIPNDTVAEEIVEIDDTVTSSAPVTNEPTSIVPENVSLEESIVKLQNVDSQSQPETQKEIPVAK